MSSSSENIIVAFDLYGTLLSTESIKKELAEHFGEEKAAALAADWRKYQLEYTWRLNSMGDFNRDIQHVTESKSTQGLANIRHDERTGKYEPFDEITERSLHHTLAEHSLELSSSAIASLMEAYDTLSTFEDVAPALTSLSTTPSITAVVFSNGTNAMVSSSVYKSADLSPHSKVFKDIVVVEEVKRFKPDPRVYEHLARTVGKEGKMGEMWLVSGNPFDVVGARMVGMKSAWVDRAGAGWVDRLMGGKEGEPTIVCKDLGEVVEAVKRSAGT